MNDFSKKRLKLGFVGNFSILSSDINATKETFSHGHEDDYRCDHCACVCARAIEENIDDCKGCNNCEVCQQG